jgi:uncharacterized protein
VILCDVNVLVYAHKEGAERHVEYRSWLEGLLNGDEAFGVADLVLSTVIRIVTHLRVFDTPSTREQAVTFARTLRSSPQAVPVRPGPRHWDLFERLGEQGNARGNLVADAYLAALAIEAGCEWITTDPGFGRFPGLRWRHPLDAAV